MQEQPVKKEGKKKKMSSLINMDGSDDPAYRYKMERVQAKVEGRGNGIKTCILHLSSVAASCKRPTAQLCKWFGIELSTQSRYLEDEDRAIINGAHETHVLQDLVFKYIDAFVKCRECGNVETTMSIKGKKKSAQIKLKCLACGATTNADEVHRLSTFIVKEATTAGKKEESKKERRKRKEKEKAEAGGEERSSDGEKKKKKKKKKKDETPEERKARKEKKKAKKEKKKAKKERKSDEDDAPVATLEALTVDDAAPLEDAIGRLREFVASGDADEVQLVRKVCELQTFSGLTPLQRIHIAYRVLVDGKPVKDIAGAAPVLAALASEFGKLGQLELLAELERAVVREQATGKSIALATSPLVVKAFYDEDACEETQLFDWYHGEALTEELSSDGWAALKSKVQPIISWLEEDDDDDDDDDDDESDDDE